MTSEEVAQHILRSIRTGRNEVCLTLKGKLLLLVNRFFPRIVDMVTKKKVRSLFKERKDAKVAARPQGFKMESPPPGR